MAESSNSNSSSAVVSPTDPTIAGHIPEALRDKLDRDLQEGDEVGEYQINGKLGEGGFGTVFSAIHPVIGKKAAVKVLARQFAGSAEMVSRFIAEARAVNTIQHPNIIDIFSFGTLEDGRHYFVMELLEGMPLEQYLEENGPLAPPELLQIMRGVARALDAAHGHGIVHRDLKPDNIFIGFTEEGDPSPRLLDFGIAKLLGGGGAGHKTRTGTPIGTPHYMSPEQCLGLDMDHLVDVYAFGVVCFEALTGQPPFEGRSFLELMHKQANADRPLASAMAPSLGTGFDEAFQRLMAIDRADRPQSVSEALALLERAAVESGCDIDAVAAPRTSQAGGSAARPAGARAVTLAETANSIRVPRPANRNAPWIALAAIIVCVALYFGTRQMGSAPTVTATPATTASAAPQPSSASSTSTTATAAPALSATASAKTTVSFRVFADMAGALVFVDGKVLGPAPGPFTMDADDKEHEIVAKHRAASISPFAQYSALGSTRKRITDGAVFHIRLRTRGPRRTRKVKPGGSLHDDVAKPDW